MSVQLKHLATFLLGAAAGAAALKYSSMSDEEKEKLMNNLKEKAGKLKDEAEVSFDKAKDYFNELGSKGTESLKDYWADAEKYIKDMMGGKKDAAPDANPAG